MKNELLDTIPIESCSYSKDSTTQFKLISFHKFCSYIHTDTL